MSTALVPPTFYVAKPRGRPACVCATAAEAAGAIVLLGSSPAAVGAVTGRRSGGLTDSELRELGRHIRACRLSAGRGWPARSMTMRGQLDERLVRGVKTR